MRECSRIVVRVNRTDAIHDLLAAAARLSRLLDAELSNIRGISLSEYQILAGLRDQPGAASTRVELARSVGLTPSGVTRALKPLEKMGIVETVKDARDARKSLATLTPAGLELVADAEGVIDDTLAGITALDALTSSRNERLLPDLTSRPPPDGSSLSGRRLRRRDRRGPTLSCRGSRPRTTARHHGWPCAPWSWPVRHRPERPDRRWSRRPPVHPAC